MDDHAADGRSRLLFDFLSEGSDVACPGCGYNLRELKANRCPECGDELVLQIGLVEPRQAACITGLVGLAAGAGFSGLLLGYFVFVCILRPRGMSPDDTQRTLLLLGGGLLVEVACLATWIKSWKSIRRMRFRWFLAVLCWLLSFTNLLVFATNIR